MVYIVVMEKPDRCRAICAHRPRSSTLVLFLVLLAMLSKKATKSPIMRWGISNYTEGRQRQQGVVDSKRRAVTTAHGGENDGMRETSPYDEWKNAAGMEKIMKDYKG